MRSNRRAYAGAPCYYVRMVRADGTVNALGVRLFHSPEEARRAAEESNAALAEIGERRYRYVVDGRP